MKVGDLVVCTDAAVPLPVSRFGLVHPGGVYRVSSVHITNYIKAGPRDEVCLQADDTGIPSPSYPMSWFRTLLACWHVSIDEWCLSCDRWEFAEPFDFLACPECGHVYRTSADLAAAENAKRRTFDEPELLSVLMDAMRQIPSCPLCTHDW